MTSAARMHAKLGQAMTSGRRPPEEAELPNALAPRRSLPTQIDTIEVEDRLRSVDEAAVDHIAESMQARGQIYPIQITTIEPGRFRLRTGAHRIAAAQTLGWTHIEAFLVDELDEEEVSLLEIDENLCRAELTPLDRCRFLAKRKAIYERLHPETKHGGDRKSQQYKDKFNMPPWQHGENSQSQPLDRAPSFVDDTAASTPWSSRTIARSTRIGERITPDLQAALADTPVASRTRDLERIADMDPEEQSRLLDRLKAADTPPKSLSALQKDPEATPPPPPTNVDRLKKVWIKCSELERTEFRDWLDLQGGE